MKRIIDVAPENAREYFLNEKHFINFDLPSYFTFQPVLDKLTAALKGRRLSDFRTMSPRAFPGVNHEILTNKDGKYAWRPLQLIHPALYVSLVENLTLPANWEFIKTRFDNFASNPRIECHSIPSITDRTDAIGIDPNIMNWWQFIEQQSISLALRYRYMLHTDITNCYGAIYTHSITWALHTKVEAKKYENRNRGDWIGVCIDAHLQDMNSGQTNGIPQGSTLMDFLAEIILGYVDLQLSEKLSSLGITSYQILRFRDDYRIFSNNSFEVEQIAKELSEVLSDLGLKLNGEKTAASDNVIKSSIKPDKRYWIVNKRKTENKQKWLIQLYLLAEQFPNSGTLETQMGDFLRFVQTQKEARKDPNIHSLISLAVEIGYRNPRVVPTTINILTFLLHQIEDTQEKIDTLKHIREKFNQVPNSTYLRIWLQRLFIKVDASLEYDDPLCRKVVNATTKIWNTDWLNSKLQDIINNTEIVNCESLASLGETASTQEIEAVLESRLYQYQE